MDHVLIAIGREHENNVRTLITYLWLHVHLMCVKCMHVTGLEFGKVKSETSIYIYRFLKRTITTLSYISLYIIKSPSREN